MERSFQYLKYALTPPQVQIVKLYVMIFLVCLERKTVKKHKFKSLIAERPFQKVSFHIAGSLLKYDG